MVEQTSDQIAALNNGAVRMHNSYVKTCNTRVHKNLYHTNIHCGP